MKLGPKIFLNKGAGLIRNYLILSVFSVFPYSGLMSVYEYFGVIGKLFRLDSLLKLMARIYCWVCSSEQWKVSIGEVVQFMIKVNNFKVIFDLNLIICSESIKCLFIIILKFDFCY